MHWYDTQQSLSLLISCAGKMDIFESRGLQSESKHERSISAIGTNPSFSLLDTLLSRLTNSPSSNVVYFVGES